MKAGIHPVYNVVKFKCVCGHIIETRSALDTKPAGDGYHHIEICAACHPFFTGKQKLMDKAGRVERFRRRYAKGDKAEKAENTENTEATPQS